MKTLIFDPSGSFLEGKGTTGWVMYYFEKIATTGQIRAEEHNSQIEYWRAHLDLLLALKPDLLVVENYALQASKAVAQIGSTLETVQLIGIIKLFCDDNKIPLVLQSPSIKSRYTNEILLRKGIITQDTRQRYYAAGVPISRHQLDAIRHGEYYNNFGKKDGKNGKSV